ncbi:uncharacterized protein LOC111064276 [Nilaparvata lugens]|uniref:uncharacterized protein LOC111064276 n=1 Tax=Nilaparvata lugens TaxID=108931 RepID=UPI00193C8B3C|nr:uncharacterized protein LOC111064276 [Nilaparvata lugens]
MLSYMVPSLEEKPPPVPVPQTSASSSTSAASKDHRLQLSLAPDRLTNGQLTNGHHAAPAPHATAPGGRKAAVSTESSASSLSSGDTQTHHDKPKPKLLNGATKNTSLKRVSFGSSKGSMVETLIYESPLQEEPEGSPTSTSDVTSTSQAADPETAGAKAPSKVRVTFFEQERPLVVSSPDDLDATMTAVTTSTTTTTIITDHHNTTYNRQESTDSGWDNPFRPDGDLSREADEIVQLIKGGKQLTTQTHAQAHEVDGSAVTVNGSAASPLLSAVSATTTSQQQSPAKGVNGTSPTDKSAPATAAVELQRVTPNDASQVEHVVLKKKPKCKCCVIQ